MVCLIIDDWYDVARAINLIILGFCLFYLAKTFLASSQNWNRKTQEYWYAMNMWCLAGLVSSLEAIILDLQLSSRIILTLVAAFATLRAITRKDRWGGDSA